VEAALYRIAQEALTNVARHAGARRVTIRLVATPGQVRLVVQDDGRGFDVSRIPGDRHGLVGMRERVELLGGGLEVTSGPGKGTLVEAAVPLEGL
jgi:two-component system, NarL family, sensor kinase